MNPYFDEKIISVASNVIRESIQETFKVNIEREAYGLTNNEGICFEILFQIPFKTSPEINIYFGLDGYTKILLLPYLTNKFNINLEEENIGGTALLHFNEYMGEFMLHEFGVFLSDIELEDIKVWDNKIIPLDKTKLRKYMLIFYLTEKDVPKNLGRIYSIVTIEKL